MTKLKLISEISIMLIIALGFVFLISLYVPFNMDEFVGYRALAYWYYPLNRLNTFVESYHGYDLAPFGKNFFLQLRSYQYIGSLPSIIYYPLFKVWPSPYSARFLGLLILAIQALLIHRIFKIDPLLSFILLLSYMPYAFQHVVDKGPVALQITSVFFICYLMPKWMLSIRNNSRLSGTYPLVIGIVFFLGVWIKIAYFFMLPGILGLMLYYIISERDMFVSSGYSKLKKIAQHLLILFCAAGIPIFILLNAFDRYGYRYYGYLTYSIQNPINRNIERLIKHLYKLSEYFINPPATANNIFIMKEVMTLAGILMAAVIIILLYYGIRQCRMEKIKYAFPLVNIALFLLTFFFIALSARTKYMHHVVLSLPFLIFALFYIGSKLYKNAFVIILLVIFLATNYISYFDLTKLKPTPFDHPSKIKLNNLLNKYADKYVFIVIDWGLFYIKALYGDKNQCVVYIIPFRNTGQAAQLKGVLNKIKRKAMFIGKISSISNLRLMQKEFPQLVNLRADFDTGQWRVWYEK